MVLAVVNEVSGPLIAAAGQTPGVAAIVAPWWLLVALPLLTALAVVFAVVITRRVVRHRLFRDVEGLVKQVARLRENPNAPAPPAVPDLRALQEQVRAMAVCYRTALTDLVAAQEAFANLRDLHERSNTEKGFSHSFIQQRKAVALLRAGRAATTRPGCAQLNQPMSRRMVCRLTPTLHWMAATPALLSFLGRTSAELNAGPSSTSSTPKTARRWRRHWPRR
jgi:hypothetical protein